MLYFQNIEIQIERLLEIQVKEKLDTNIEHTHIRLDLLSIKNVESSLFTYLRKY